MDDINKRNTESFRVALEKALARITALEETIRLQNNSISILQERINTTEGATNMVRAMVMGRGATG